MKRFVVSMLVLTMIFTLAIAPMVSAALPTEAPTVLKTGIAVKGTPVIDGEIDAVWNTAPYIGGPLDSWNLLREHSAEPWLVTDTHAYVRILWSDNSLYLLAQVVDSAVGGTYSGDAIHNNDSMDVYIDQSNTKASKYADAGPGAHQFKMDYTGKAAGTHAAEVQTEVKMTSYGYIFEAKVPWVADFTPSADSKIGFDFTINDNMDGGSIRQAIVCWSNWFEDKKGSSWKDPRHFGEIALVDAYTDTITLPALTDVATPAPSPQTSDNSTLLVFFSLVIMSGAFLTWRKVAGVNK